jgi:hypothetical protein
LLTEAGQFLAIAGIVGSALIFIATSWSNARKLVAWRDDVQIIQSSLLDGFDLYNAGDGTVYIDRIEFRPANWEKGRKGPPTIFETVRQTVAPKQVATLPFERLGGSIVDDLSREEWMTQVPLARGPDHDELCLVINVLPQNAPALQLYRERLKERFLTFEVQAIVQYRSMEKGQRALSKVYAAEGFLLRRIDCAAGQASR